jgi:hypothetical protein
MITERRKRNRKTTERRRKRKTKMDNNNHHNSEKEQDKKCGTEKEPDINVLLRFHFASVRVMLRKPSLHNKRKCR